MDLRQQRNVGALLWTTPAAGQLVVDFVIDTLFLVDKAPFSQS